MRILSLMAVISLIGLMGCGNTSSSDTAGEIDISPVIAYQGLITQDGHKYFKYGGIGVNNAAPAPFELHTSITLSVVDVSTGGVIALTNGTYAVAIAKGATGTAAGVISLIVLEIDDNAAYSNKITSSLTAGKSYLIRAEVVCTNCSETSTANNRKDSDPFTF